MSKARPGRGSRSSACQAGLQYLAGALHAEGALDVAATVLDVMRADPLPDRISSPRPRVLHKQSAGNGNESRSHRAVTSAACSNS